MKKYLMSMDIPENITTPGKVETPIGTPEYCDGVPIGDTTQRKGTDDENRAE